jgi:hypothetical protein
MGLALELDWIVESERSATPGESRSPFDHGAPRLSPEIV